MFHRTDWVTEPDENTSGVSLVRRATLCNDPDMNEELITTTEAATLLGKSSRSVQRMVDSGDLVPVRRLAGPNGAYLFNRADIEVLVAA